MLDDLYDALSYLKIRSIYELHKGFSNDRKFVIDEAYLVRVFSKEEEIKRREEFHTLRQLSKLSKFVPKAIKLGELSETEKAYMVLSYLPGTDAAAGLQLLSESEQYAAGYAAGRELKKLHQVPAPASHPSWFSVKQKKINNYITQFEQLDMDTKIKKNLISYIHDHTNIMKGRPNRFQHDDFHPSNLLLTNKRFSGIIDFEKMDWGDPIHDLQKLGFFSKGVSVPFTIGILDGYHNGQHIDQNFWELYAFYSAVHIVSAMVWGYKHSKSQFDLLIEYSLEVLKDHENFKRKVPIWYEGKK